MYHTKYVVSRTRAIRVFVNDRGSVSWLIQYLCSLYYQVCQEHLVYEVLRMTRVSLYVCNSLCMCARVRCACVPPRCCYLRYAQHPPLYDHPSALLGAAVALLCRPSTHFPTRITTTTACWRWCCLYSVLDCSRRKIGDEKSEASTSDANHG